MEKVLQEILSTVKTLVSKVDKLDSKVDKLDSRVGSLETKVDENTQILRALEHKADIHKAELDKLNIKVTKIDGKLVNITDDINFLNMSTSKNRYNIGQLRNDFEDSKIAESRGENE